MKKSHIILHSSNEIKVRQNHIKYILFASRSENLLLLMNIFCSQAAEFSLNDKKYSLNDGIPRELRSAYSCAWPVCLC